MDRRPRRSRPTRSPLSATVRNAGTAAVRRDRRQLLPRHHQVGTAPVGGARGRGDRHRLGATSARATRARYTLTAKVDEANTVIEQNEAQQHVHQPDLAGGARRSPAPTWSRRRSAGRRATRPAATPSPSPSPSGTRARVASAGGAHGITLTVLNDAGTAVAHADRLVHRHDRRRRDHDRPVNLGTWTAANGRYTVRVVARRRRQRAAGQAGRTTPATRPLFVGRGANMPYDMYEAEDGVDRRRRAGRRPEPDHRRPRRRGVRPPGRHAQRQRRATSSGPPGRSTNTLVTRFSIPDCAGRRRDNVDAQHLRQRHLPQGDHADLEVRVALRRRGRARATRRARAARATSTTRPTSCSTRPSRPAARSGCRRTRPTRTHVRDRLHQPRAGVADRQPRPGAVHRARPASRHQDVQNALDQVRMDTTGKLSASTCRPGDYQTAQQVPGVRQGGQGRRRRPLVHPVQRTGRPGEHRRRLPGRRRRPTARRSADFAYFGNYTSRIDGPGKVCDFANVVEHDDRQHLGRAHGVPATGASNTDNIDDQELPDPQHCSPTAST